MTSYLAKDDLVFRLSPYLHSQLGRKSNQTPRDTCQALRPCSLALMVWGLDFWKQPEGSDLLQALGTHPPCPELTRAHVQLIKAWVRGHHTGKGDEEVLSRNLLQEN